MGAGHRHRGRCLRVRGGCPGWSREAGGAGVWLAKRRGGRRSPPRHGARRRWRPCGATREIGWFMDRAWESEYTSPGVGAGCRHAGIMQPKCPVGEPRPEYGESRSTLAPVRLSLIRWASGRLLRARSAPTCGDHRHRASAVGRRRRSARSRGWLHRLRSRKPGGADTGPGPRFRTRPERRAVKPAHLPHGKASTLRLRSICRVSAGPYLTRRIRILCRLRERARAHRPEPCRRMRAEPPDDMRTARSRAVSRPWPVFSGSPGLLSVANGRRVGRASPSGSAPEDARRQCPRVLAASLPQPRGRASRTEPDRPALPWNHRSRPPPASPGPELTRRLTLTGRESPFGLTWLASSADRIESAPLMMASLRSFRHRVMFVSAESPNFPETGDRTPPAGGHWGCYNPARNISGRARLSAEEPRGRWRPPA